MSTYTSPVTLSNFQLYLNDQSADPTVHAYYQSLLDYATERIYTYLDRDYTASAVKTDIFFGNCKPWRRLHQVAGAVTAWSSVDSLGAITTNDPTTIHLFEGGELAVLSSGTFDPTLEHRITYSLPSSLSCPETVAQVITEVAAVALRESKQGSGSLGEQMSYSHDSNFSSRAVYVELSDRHRELLSPYRRINL